MHVALDDEVLGVQLDFGLDVKGNSVDYMEERKKSLILGRQKGIGHTQSNIFSVIHGRSKF